MSKRFSIRPVNIRDVPPFVTRDTSIIRELLAHRNSPIKNQSLAEARIKPGASTIRHYHKKAEEIYFITRGKGRIRLGKKQFNVGPGDAIPILPGTPHRITNTGKVDLVILCCCAPAYENKDTVLLEKSGS